MTPEEMPPLAYDTDGDELPCLLDAADSDWDSDSEGVPELVGDSDDEDEMPALKPDTTCEFSSSRPPSLEEDNEFDDLPELIDANDEPVTRNANRRARLAVRTMAYAPQQVPEEVPQTVVRGWTQNGKSTLIASLAYNDKASAESHLSSLLYPGPEKVQCTLSTISEQQWSALSCFAPGMQFTDSPGLDDSAQMDESENLKSKMSPGLNINGAAKAGECPVASTGVANQGLVKGVECPVKTTGAGATKLAELQEWSTGLFDCFQDMPTCLLGAFCPSILYAKTRHLATGQPCALFGFMHLFAMVGGTFLGGCFLCHWGYAPCHSTPLRNFIRSKYGLDGATGAFPADGMIGDCLVHYWCHPCALCQEHREMKMREEMEKGVIDTTPPVVEEMEKRVVMEPAKAAGTGEDAGGIYYTLLAGE